MATYASQGPMIVLPTRQIWAVRVDRVDPLDPTDIGHHVIVTTKEHVCASSNRHTMRERTHCSDTQGTTRTCNLDSTWSRWSGIWRRSHTPISCIDLWPSRSRIPKWYRDEESQSISTWEILGWKWHQNIWYLGNRSTSVGTGYTI